MKNFKIFLDDIRNPFWIYDDFNDWVIVRNREEFISKIEEIGRPDVI